MKTIKQLDNLDKKILRELQKDCSLSLEAISKKIGSSKTPIWNRINRMIKQGVVSKQVALINPKAVNCGNTFFVFVSTSKHDASWLAKFTEVIKSMPQITEAHRLAGNIDYILKIQLESPEKYDEVYKELVSKISIFQVTSSLSMETIKYSTELHF